MLTTVQVHQAFAADAGSHPSSSSSAFSASSASSTLDATLPAPGGVWSSVPTRSNGSSAWTRPSAIATGAGPSNPTMPPTDAVQSNFTTQTPRPVSSAATTVAVEATQPPASHAAAAASSSSAAAGPVLSLGAVGRRASAVHAALISSGTAPSVTHELHLLVRRAPRLPFHISDPLLAPTSPLAGVLTNAALTHTAK
jgi:hypothetical protein